MTIIKEQNNTLPNGFIYWLSANQENGFDTLSPNEKIELIDKYIHEQKLKIQSIRREISKCKKSAQKISQPTLNF